MLRQVNNKLFENFHKKTTVSQNLINTLGKQKSSFLNYGLVHYLTGYVVHTVGDFMFEKQEND